MNKESDEDTYIAPITVRLYPGTDDRFTMKARNAFDDEVTGYTWALRRDGAIVAKVLEDCTNKISLSIDAEDPLTLRSFNKLPRYFKRRMDMKEDEIANMRMKVQVHLQISQDFLFWPESDPTDVIIFTREGTYVESVKQSHELILSIGEEE